MIAICVCLEAVIQKLNLIEEVGTQADNDVVVGGEGWGLSKSVNRK